MAESHLCFPLFNNLHLFSVLIAREKQFSLIPHNGILYILCFLLFAVPLYEYQGQRETLVNWVNTKGEQGLKEYHQEKEKNFVSIDALLTTLFQVHNQKSIDS